MQYIAEGSRREVSCEAVSVILPRLRRTYISSELDMPNPEENYQVGSTPASRKSGGILLDPNREEIGSKTYTSSSTAG